MAITLKEACALNGTPELTSFSALQDACKNTGHFSNDKPINHLSSWEDYSYSSSYSITLSLSSSSVSASGGAITVTYTIKDITDDVLVSGVSPTVTSTIGSVSDITKTNDKGVGTAKITVDSLGSTVQAATTGTISVTYINNGKISFSRGANAANSYYKDLVVSLSYGNASPSTSNTTVSPSLTVKATPCYTSGSPGTQITVPASGYTVGYTESTASSYASVNSSSGVITWNSNAKVTSNRTVGVTADVTCKSTYSSLKGFNAVTATHTKDTATYGNPTGTLTYPTAAWNSASAGTYYTPTLTVSQAVT